jgi:hypothetical protein
MRSPQMVGNLPNADRPRLEAGFIWRYCYVTDPESPFFA